MRKYGKWLFLSLGLMLAVLATMTKFSDPQKVGAVLGELGVENSLVIMGFGLASLLLRNYRWKTLLRGVGQEIGYGELFPIFVAGQAASLITPGKSGDLLRAHGLKNKVGLSRRRGMATIFVERFTDFGLILLFALYGFAAFGTFSLLPVAVVAAAMVVAAGALVSRRFAKTVYRPFSFVFRRVRRLEKAGPVLKEGYESVRNLGKRKEFYVSCLLGVLVWSVEFLRMHFTLLALGGAVSQVEVAFAACVSILVGMATMLPGGAGGYEAAYLAVLTSSGVEMAVVAGALIVERVVGYGFTLLVGLISMKWVKV